MTSCRHTKATLVFLIACATVAIGDRTLSGQTSSTPAVNVVRNALLYETMWPADFNRDGKTDLVASADPRASDGDVIVVALGTGTGSFGTPIKSAFKGRVLAVGDMNGDGTIDVIATADHSQSVFVLPGSSDGALGGAVLVDPDADVLFAVAADLDGDGRRDLIVGTDGANTLSVYPGNGELTFRPRIALPMVGGAQPHDAIVADFNGDGRKDFAVVNFGASSFSVFLNQGNLTFTGTDFGVDLKPTDVTAADLNGDGRLDLVISEASGGPGISGDSYVEGWALVMPGNGDGTFTPGPKYRVANGAYSIVVGDFTRDGILDIATANRSAIVIDDCGSPRKTWDSVSILPGEGDGTFGAAATFSIGDQSDLDDTQGGDRFRNSVTTLNTSDLNGDHHTDLIASYGALLFNIAAVPNRPPTVSAGPDRTFTSTVEFHLRAVAADPDQDLLTYRWTDSAEPNNPIPPVPDVCWQAHVSGPHTYTVTVDDGHGHRVSDSVTYTFVSPNPPSVTVTAPAAGSVVTAGAPFTITWTGTTNGGSPIAQFDIASSSDDGAHWTPMAECTGLPASASQCVWNNPGPVSEQAHVRVTATDTSNATGSGDSGRFSIRSSGGGGVPEGWNQQDIGAVAAAGSATYNNGVFTVKGSGADIWGTADEFHYVYRTLNGAASGPVDLTTRVDSVQNVNAWTKAGLMVRSTLDAGSPHVSIFITPGKGVAFQRRTSAGAVSVNTSGAAITAPVWLRLTVNGGQVRGFYKKNATDLWTELGITQFPDWVDTYGGLAVTSHADGTLATAAFSNVTVAPPPSPLATALVGGATGTVSSDSVLRNYTLTDRGTDIWGTADQFTFAYQSWSGDGRVEAMIPGMTNTNVWTKAGVMFRSTLSAGSPHVSLFVTPSTKGIAMQYRPTANAASVQVAQIPRTASRVFLRLTRSGNTFTGAWSEDWSTWHTIGTISVAVAPNALAGIVLTSHDASATASAAFADPSVSR